MIWRAILSSKTFRWKKLMTIWMLNNTARYSIKGIHLVPKKEMKMYGLCYTVSHVLSWFSIGLAVFDTNEKCVLINTEQYYFPWKDMVRNKVQE